MQRTIYRLLCFCFLLGSFNSVKAIDEKYAAPALRGNQLAADSTSMVMDAVYFDPALKPFQSTYFVKNLITFQIDESYRYMLPDEFDATVTFKIHYTYDNNGTPATGVTDNINLHVGYTKYTTYKNKEVYIENDWYKVEIEIVSMSGTGNLNDYRDALMLTNEIFINREYNFSCTNNAIQQIFTNNAPVSTKGELNVYWLPERAADEYDLEWTYIDDSALTNFYKAGTSQYDPKKLFANNATRVSLSKETYNIPLLYEASGHLFYRVRAVQVKQDGQRLESVWSSDYTNGLGTYSFAGLDASLNWQATTSFAEEGKRKSVVQYYDGALKSRQIVTKDNTTDTTIIAETFYDHQGRGVIQVMPTPSLSSIIKYTPGFNRLNGAEYTKDAYDGLWQDSCYCAEGAPVMDTLFGAAQYYSPQNPLSAGGYHKYIPNAKGYVFSETRYTPDNTGRVSIQSGAGETFQIGKGHETKKTYNTADQEELDALFGTEVGNASHYFKNTVRDANGQVSISYVDMHGRTIATALAGTPPVSVDALPSNQPYFITKKLIDSNSNVIKGTVIESSKSLVVTKAGQHRFKYSLLPDSISIKDCNNINVCYDCIYDLQITITDECNNTTMTNGEPVVISRTNYQLASDCNALSAFPAVDTTVYLQQGSYLVTKTLTLNKQAMDYYRDIFVARNTCRSLEQTIQEQKNLLATTIQCEPACETCTASLGDWETFRNNYMHQAGIPNSDTANYRTQAAIAYNTQLEECKKLCEDVVALHQSAREQMLADVTPPYGQYANPGNIDFYSVFSSKDFYPQNYKRVDGAYTDENGQAEIADPKNMDQDAFVASFKNSWAETLLQMHPEYQKLKKSEELAASNTWDQQFGKTETYQEAVAKGYLNPGNFSTRPAGAHFNHNATYRDPFFTDLINEGKVSGSYFYQMQSGLLDKVRDANDNAISMWSLATILANCPTSEAGCVDQYKPLDNAFVIGADCTGDRDLAWKYFREMYLQKKREFVAEILRVAQEQSTYYPDLTGLNQSHRLIFYDPTLMPTGDVPANEQAARDSLQKYINDNCAAYVQQWMSELEPCYNSTDLEWIIPRLVQVCQEGGDESHFFGASTVKPSSTYEYKSFEDVLKAYSAISGKPYNATCNAYLISAPVSYDQQPVYTNKPVYQKPDSCECATLNSLYSQYQYVKKDTSFADYLYRTTGTRMTSGALDTLRMACNGQVNCNNLSAPVYLPPVLQCGVKDVCVTCITVDTLMRSFKHEFPFAFPSLTESDSLQTVSNRLFEKYMNYKTGFSKTADEYLSFIDACNITPKADCSDSNLEDILDQFNTIYKNRSTFTPGGQYNGDTTDYDMYVNFPVSWAESIQNGVLTFPARFQSNPGALEYYYIKPLQIPENGLSIEARLKLPLLDSTNCNYPDFQFQLRPQGGFVNALFYNKSIPCNKTSGRFDLADSTHPSHIITDHPQMAIDMTNWVKIKMTILKNKYQIYVADTFLMEVPYTGTLTKLNSFGFFFGTRTTSTKAVPYIDYIKVYNGCNELVMDQEFNSLTDKVCPDLSVRVSPDDFKTAFTSYYNQSRNTNLTYAQIESIYASSCNGLKLNTCSNSCNKLKDVWNSYTQQRLNDSLKFERNQITPTEGFTYWRSDIYKNGVAHIPDQYVNTVNYGSHYKKNDTLCTGNVFTYVTRFKRPGREERRSEMIIQVRYSDDAGPTLIGPVFYLYGNNPIASDTTVMLNQSGMIGFGREGNYNWPTKPFVSDYFDWAEVKITHSADNIWRVYFNDSLVNERYTPLPVRKIDGFQVIFQGRANNGYVDYHKVYDQNGQLQYVEEFEDALQSPSNDPAAFRCAESCQAKFTNYYNQATNSSLTYAQIQQLYSECGLALDGCGYGNNADSLIDWLNTYKKYGGIPHLDASGSDTTYWKGNFNTFSISSYQLGVPLGEIIKNGNLALPASYVNTIPNPYQVNYRYWRDSICQDPAGFTWETRMKLPDSLVNNNIYNASSWFWLYTQDSTSGSGTMLMAVSKVDGMGAAVCTHHWDSKYSCANENVPGQHMNDWRVIKFQFRDRDFKYFIDDSLVAQRTLDAPMRLLSGWNIAPFSLKAQIDYVKMYKPDGTLLYNENFNDPHNLATFDDRDRCSPCGTRFAKYFNQRNGSNLTYEQIDSIYYNSAGIKLGVCEETPLLCGKTEPVFAPVTWEPRTTCADSTLFSTSTGVLIHEAYRDSLIGNFNDRYLAKCLSARYNESFTVYQPISEFHYTLYYYDQAGNLLKTVAPQGVDVSKFAWASAWSDSVTAARRNKQLLTPGHKMPTQYRYNTLNQLVAQHSPDGGLTEFWYDRLGRMAISRNARQMAAGGTEENRLYSYTKYDPLGRIAEVGQVSNTGANGGITDGITRNQDLLNNWLMAINSRREQITNTVYDLPYTGFDGIVDARQIISQQNLRNRVSYITLTETGTSNAYNQATFYTYDMRGNVDHLLQDYGSSSFATTANMMNKNENRWKKISYQYDLISGKVKMAMYQHGWMDGFFHRYNYDAENRLTLVETSRDSLVWEKDARYDYYRHGPLARITLGDQQVQGIDYAYTLQGWLKGINSTGGTEATDMGEDAKTGSLNQYTAKDALGLTLNYFGNDYAAINGTPFPGYSAHLPTNAYRPLYNGNISSSSVYQKKFDYYNSPGGPLIFYNYKYDQLNRLTEQDAYKGFNTANNSWSGMTTMGQNLKERIAYDANGNILKYLRNSITGTAALMDSLNYYYYANTNQLKQVTDNVPANGYVHPENKIIDIDGQANNNYGYDAIGNLIRDDAAGITNIKWNVYNKIQEINKAATAEAPATNIKYSYDVAGNRIGQELTSGGTKYYTWYVRDGQGNILSTYAASGNVSDLADLDLEQKTWYLYGSSRLGIQTVNEGVDDGPGNMQYYYHNKFYDRGWKEYELTNHLGNVLATVSDRKFGVPSGSSSLIAYYEPHIVTAQDYYPFGMMSRVELPGNDKSYVFGFNGKMNDNDVKGLGNQQDYGMRIYDPRIGKFLSADPLFKKFPFYTPYQFASNSPILSIDIDGMESSNNVNENEKDGAGNKMRLPGNAQILSRLNGNDELNNHQKSEAVEGGVNAFSINGKVFTARFLKGKFERYESKTDDKEVYNEDNYVYGGFIDDKKPTFDASWEKVEIKGVDATAKLNYKYFGLKTSYELGSFDYHNYTDWSQSELAMDIGFEGSVTKVGMGLRLGSTYNNFFADGSAKLFNVEGNFNGGIFTGEDRKHGLGVNVGVGASVGEGNIKFGETFLGMKVAGSVGGTVVSAHIGANNSYLYDSKAGVFSFKVGANLGLLLGVKGGLSVDVPVRMWKNNISAAIKSMW